MVALLWLFACEGGAGRVHAEEETTALAGPGWALAAPSGSIIAATADTLKVDAPDGRSWFDVSWVDSPANAQTALLWGRSACSPVLYDQGWTEGNRFATGGICEISRRRHWVIVVLERIGERTLQTTFLADSRRMPYEDAWVACTRTALTLGGGPDPLAPPDPVGLRERIRAAGLQKPGTIPIPGGGLLATRILPQLGDVWAARDSSPPGGSFSP